MSTTAGVAYSNKPDSKEAGAEAAKEALNRAGAKKADIALLFSTSKHDPKQLHEGVRSVLGPETKLIGGYGVGAITNDKLSYGGYEVGIGVISSSTIKSDVFIQKGLGTGDEMTVGSKLAEQITKKKYDGEPNIVLFYDSVRGQEGNLLNMATPILEGMGEVLKKWQRAAGGGFLGDLQFQPAYQWFNDRVEQQSAMALVLHGGVRMDTMIMHGCKPSSDYQTITKTEGPVVLELNGKPALEVIQDLLGPESDKSWEEYPLWVTFGLNKGEKFDDFKEENYANRLVLAVDKERKGLVMFEPDLKPGMEVQLMRREVNMDYIKTQVAALRKQLGNRKPVFALYINCVGRASLYCGADAEDAAAVQKELGDIPLLGFYSGVEIAKVGKDIRALDWTGVLCLFSE